ncbi:MAG: site-specific DNA-methyltransferase, partial [Bacteroidetes bacterium]|nr:site-specific DNA-methyltransferase [Bacteroidota bacterium]
MKTAYKTQFGTQIIGDSLEVLQSYPDNSIDLVMTSPPFALLRKKEYGNEDQHEYVDWLTKFAKVVYEKLKPTGSFVLDIGGAYKKGVPVRSLYNFRVPLAFCDEVGFHLAEDFYWFNPSKLPSPIEWVNKRKIRVKDAVNNVWWFSKTPYPKADVTKVLAPYSERMEKLLENPDKYYSPKERPSGHNIGSSFSSDNGGAIPPNLLQIPNSESNSSYLANCKKAGLKGHPARFPSKLPEFFIKFLTEKDDLVVDIFGGSNTTGFTAEKLKRKWVSIDLDSSYAAMSSFRFMPKSISEKDLLNVYYSILAGKELRIMEFLAN